MADIPLWERLKTKEKHTIEFTVNIKYNKNVYNLITMRKAADDLSERKKKMVNVFVFFSYKILSELSC